VDATNTVVPGFYLPILDNNSGDTQLDELSPAYTTATPAFSAADPAPTVFSGFTGSQSFGNVLDFSTAAGPITLEFFFDVGLGASITSVPEPSSLVLFGIGGSIGLVAAWGRRKSLRHGAVAHPSVATVDDLADTSVPRPSATNRKTLGPAESALG
jgi:PEP-CTERM motif